MTTLPLDDFVFPLALERALAKYSDDQPRDESGRWTSGDGGYRRNPDGSWSDAAGAPADEATEESDDEPPREPRLVRPAKAAGGSPLVVRAVDPAIMRLAERMEPAMRRAFLAAVQGAAGVIDLGDLADAVRSGRVGQIEAAARLDVLGDEARRLLLPVIGRTFALGVASGAEAVGVELSYGFDLKNPEAIAWAQQRAAEFVTEVAESTRLGIRALVAASQAEGTAPADLAREIREVVGLHSRQAAAVAAFRARMAADGVAASVAAKRAARYADALLDRRAETIARTETVTASAEGQEQLWTRAQQAGDLGDDVVRVWAVTRDDRLDLEVCEPLDEAEAPIGGAFEPGGYERPPAHPNCRCAVVLRFDGDRPRRRAFAPGIVKYSPDQPRDEQGQWTDSGGSGEGRNNDPSQWVDGDEGGARLARDARREAIDMVKRKLGKTRQQVPLSLSRNSDAWFASYTPDERVVAATYQGSSYEINGLLRGTVPDDKIMNVESVRKSIDTLHGAMAKPNARIDDGAVLWRGAKLRDADARRLVPGASFTDRGFFSTTTKASVAFGFTLGRSQNHPSYPEDGVTGIVFKLTTEGARGAQLRLMDEVLLDKSATVSIQKVTRYAKAGILVVEGTVGHT